MSGELPDLDDELTAIVELARRCVHASGSESRAAAELGSHSVSKP